MKIGALVSSGKDSIYALSLVKNVTCLITIISENQDSYMFHSPNLSEIQAKALDLPIIIQKTKGEKEKELLDLKKALIKAKEKFKIDGIVSGALFSEYQKKRIEKICKELNLKSFTPLWHIDQKKVMRDILNSGFKFIIIKIAADGLDESWLGKEITHEDIDKLVELNKKLSINIAFEGGEAETLMISGPIFKKKLKIIKAKKEMENSYTGVYNIKKVELI